MADKTAVHRLKNLGKNDGDKKVFVGCLSKQHTLFSIRYFRTDKLRIAGYYGYDVLLLYRKLEIRRH